MLLNQRMKRQCSNLLLKISITHFSKRSRVMMKLMEELLLLLL